MFGYGYPFEMDYAPDHVRELERLDSMTLELGAVHASPHGEDALEQCQKELMEAGFPPVPPVHTDFLRLCGGFWFHEIRIYGPAEVPAKGAMDGPLPSLVTANRLIREEGVDLGNRLLIGRSWRGVSLCLRSFPGGASPAGRGDAARVRQRWSVRHAAPGRGRGLYLE